MSARKTRLPFGFTLTLLLAASIVAQAPAQTRIEHLTATDLFAMAERAVVAGQIDTALAYYEALTRDPDDQIRAEARFRKGMLLADHGRYRDAAVAFRALLDEKPDALRARLELARVLAQLGDEPAARRELRQAQAQGLPIDVAITVNRFSQALRSSNRLGGSIEVSLAPDSNVNRATQQRTLDTVIAPLTLSRDARARSGLGLKLAGSGYARIAVNDDLSILPRVSGLANLYRSSTFEDISAEGLIGLEWRHGIDRWTPSIGQSWRWYGGRAYARTQTATLGWVHPAGPSAQWLATGSASRARYQQNDLQDGGLYSGSVSYERAITARTGISATLSATRQSARDPGFSTWSGGGSLLGWHEWGRTTSFLSVGLHHLVGDAPLFVFPDRRKEWLIDTTIGATFRRFTVHGFAPLVRIGYERNHSTVGLYDYSRINGNVGIVRAF